jgi:GR25 family glycosyltransferase involved in LPS biosynthesis
MDNYNVYYINLDERLDRKKHIEIELLKIFPKETINRISATKNINGAVGCTQSHINTLFTFLKSDKKYCFVFEDDFQLLYSVDETKNILNNIFSENFNAVMLSYNALGIEYNYDTIKNNMCLFKNGITTAGYLVNKDFAKILLNNFLEGMQKLMETGQKRLYAIDMYWLNLQTEENKFYACVPCLGCQMNSFSNVENVTKEYIQCNTCIILLDNSIDKNNQLLKKSPFKCLHYDNINNETINKITKLYPNVKFLFRLNNMIFNLLKWIDICNIYKQMIYQNLAEHNVNKILEINMIDNHLHTKNITKSNKNYQKSFMMLLK